jgi:large subunit ribosomal protein L19
MAEETQNQEVAETEAVETPEVQAEEVKIEETPAEEVVAAEPVVAEPVVEEPGIIEGALNKSLPEIRQGDMVKVYQKIKEVKDGKTKERTQVFEGQILAIKHGRGITATMTVRKVIDGIGVEKIFPIHSPIIEKIEITKQTKTRRAKLYFLRTAKGRKAKLKATVHAKSKEEGESEE